MKKFYYDNYGVYNFLEESSDNIGFIVVLGVLTSKNLMGDYDLSSIRSIRSIRSILEPIDFIRFILWFSRFIDSSLEINITY